MIIYIFISQQLHLYLLVVLPDKVVWMPTINASLEPIWCWSSMSCCPFQFISLALWFHTVLAKTSFSFHTTSTPWANKTNETIEQHPDNKADLRSLFEYKEDVWMKRLQTIKPNALNIAFNYPHNFTGCTKWYVISFLPEIFLHYYVMIS